LHYAHVEGKEGDQKSFQSSSTKPITFFGNPTPKHHCNFSLIKSEVVTRIPLLSSLTKNATKDEHFEFELGCRMSVSRRWTFFEFQTLKRFII
jgi:hypothetical protein